MSSRTTNRDRTNSLAGDENESEQEHDESEQEHTGWSDEEDKIDQNFDKQLEQSLKNDKQS